MSSRFYFSPSASSSSLSNPGSDDDTPLPFPQPLTLTSFHSPDFSPPAFLASLTSRFQTLEDLQTELRDLSASVQKSLVDLVNDNYAEFLTLGETLRGGEERIEDVRVGVLGFQRDLEGVRGLVASRREEVRMLVEAKRGVRREIGEGRGLLGVDERMGRLERKLNLDSGRKTNKADARGGKDAAKQEESEDQEWSAEWVEEPPLMDSDDDEDDEYNEGSDEASQRIPPRLKRRTEEFLILKVLIARHSPRHPFIQAQEGRLRKIQEVILSDLGVAVRAEPQVKIKQQLFQLRASIEE